MRRNFLLQLTVAIFLPSLGSFLLAWVGFTQFEKSMEGLAGSYVQNMARVAAVKLESSRWDLGRTNQWPSDRYRQPAPSEGLSELFMDDGRLPGLFAVFDSAGNLIYSTSDVKLLSMMWDEPPTMIAPHKVRGPDRKFYTVAVYPVLNKDLFVLAAVSWDKLLGPMVELSVFWPFIMGVLGLVGIFSVYLMWLKVIRPLKDLEEEVSDLNWGEEVPNENSPEAVDELQRLRKAITVLAHSAIERVKLSRSYVNDLVKVQEEERSRIAREIHDGPLQDVTALIQRIRLLSMDMDSPDKCQKRLDEAESVAMAGVREMREICNNLTPPWLDLGLAQAITELSERLSRQLGIKITLDLHEIPELSEDATLAFFRVVQEAVNNSAHHADASEVRIKLRDSGEKIILTIKDDGKGFSVPENITELRVHGHRGMSNMKERMALIGGTVDINSAPGRGTEIICELPFKDD